MSDYFFSSRPGFPWSIYPIGLPALAVVAVLLILFTIWTYLGHPQATRKRVFIVLMLRLGALLIALLTAVRPSVGVNENPKQPATLLVGVDVSESMTVKDELGGQARIDAVRKTMEKCQPLFDELLTEQNVNVVVYKFGPTDFNEATSRWEPTAPADAKRSDYGIFLNRIYERWQTEPRIRGVIVIGEGADNGETTNAANEAMRFGRRGTPVHTVIVGQEGSMPDVKDIAVTSIQCDPSPAFIKNPVVVTARVNSFGFLNARVTARVSYTFEGKDRVWNEDFTLDREKNNELKVNIEAPDKKGEIKIKVEVGLEKDGKIVALPGELSPLNNWSETYLTVLKEGVRVLIVDQLRWEETLIRDALRSQKGVDLYEVIRQRGLTPTESEKQLLNLDAQAYDVVIIGNVSATELQTISPGFLDKLAELTKTKGTGVMFLGGEHAFQGDYKGLLPITGGPIVDKLDPEGNPEPAYRFATVPTPDGLARMFRVSVKQGDTSKPVDPKPVWTRLNNHLLGVRLNGYNRLILPPGGKYTVFAWAPRLLEPEPKVFTVEPSRPEDLAPGTPFDGKIHEPLLVGSERGAKGAARWLAFGAFDTYLWTTYGQRSVPKTREGVELHHQFWRQCVLWLAYQDDEEGQIYARPQYRQMKTTQEQTVRVGIKLPNGTEDPDPKLKVRILPLAPGTQVPKPEDEAKATPLTVITDKEGHKVIFRPTVPGEYFVVATGPVQKAGGKIEEERGTARFIAIPDVSDEMLRVNADREFMSRLAVPTGGKALTLDELPGFLKELKAETPQDSGKKPRYYPDWHRNRSRGFLPLWLVLFTLLLGAEWGLRRLWGMV